jgi:Na+/proline symporter
MDWAMLVLYFVGITWLGLHAAKKVTSMADFVMPRRFSWWMMAMHGFGTSTHSDEAVGVASKTWTTGLSGIWYSWNWLFVTPFYWWIAPMMRRFRAFTTGDVLECRYDSSVTVLYAVVGLMKFTVNIGVMLYASSAFIESASGGAIPAGWAIGIVTVLFVTYGIAGGLGAAIVTDFVQGLMTIAFSFILLPIAMNAVGGLAGMKETIPTIVTDKNMFSLVAPGNIGWFYLLVVPFNLLLGVAVQPQNMGTCAAGRTEFEGAVGFMGGNMLKRVCTVAWCLTGLAAVAHYSGVIDNPDQVYGKMAREFLPMIMPGMLGLFMAAMLATVMNSCDSFMVAASALITQNVYKRVRPGRSDRHYLLAARVAGVSVVALGLAFAFTVQGVVAGLEILWKANAMMAIAFWLGIFWRRATSAGAWAATLCTMGTWWLTTLSPVVEWLATLPALESAPFVVNAKGGQAVYLPWQMLFYLLGGLLGGLLGSLLTKPKDKQELDDFYALLRTPVQSEEQPTIPCTLPEGVVAPPRRVFFPNSSLELPIPSKRAMAGFLIGWACVGVIVGVVAWFIAE